MPTDKEVSCSSSCPQIGHSLGQHTLQSTWVTPSVQERLQDHHKGPQEGSGCPRSTNSEAAAEAECPAPAPQGATADDAALWDTAQRIVSEAVRRAVAQIVAAGQEPEEQQDLAQHMDLQDENSKEGCQGGDTIHSTWINPSVQEHLQDAPAGPQEGSGLTSCTDTEAAAEAERPAPAQHSPTEDDVDLSDIVEYIVSEAVRRAEAEIQGPGQQPLEQQDLAQCTDVPMAAPAPAGLEAIEAHLAGEDEGQASTAPLVPAAKEEEENTAMALAELIELLSWILVMSLGLSQSRVDREVCYVTVEADMSLWVMATSVDEISGFWRWWEEQKYSQTSCFWEKQPSGCLRIGCAFQHSKARNINGLFLPPNNNVPLQQGGQERTLHPAHLQESLRNQENISLPVLAPLIIRLNNAEDEQDDEEDDDKEN
ncbi:hypothetical protein Q9966_000255 [Columba livia]|nr:hypothetical protein Q9966_000255 [Columba livia]